VLDNGDVLEIAPKGAKVIGRRHAVGIAIDGTALGPVDGQAMRERRRLARRGVMTVFVAVDLRRGELLDGPHLSAMGVAEEVEEIIKLAEEAAATAFGKLDRESRRSQPAIAEGIRRAVMGAIRREIERKPLIEVMVYDAGRIVR
jgi:ribonuclease J